MLNRLAPLSRFSAAWRHCRDASLAPPSAHNCVAALFAIWVATGAPVSADLITFQDQPVGVYPGATVALPIDGTTVVFAGAGLRIRDVEFFNNRPIQKFPHGASRVLSTDGDIQTITATFAGDFTSDFVGITNWLSGVHKKGEIDTIRMSAFDSTNMLLGTVVSSDLFISFASPGIAKVTFADASGGGSGYLLDDFRLSPVPEPATFVLVGTGAAALITSRRRKHRARVTRRDT